MAKNTGKTSAQKVTAANPVKEQGSLWQHHVVLSLLLAAIAFVVYANTLKNGFVLDDSVMIVNNEYVKEGVQAIPKLLVTPHQAGHWVNPNDEYRPLALVLHAIEYQLWELSPMPYHFINILLFAGCVVLLFLFLRELLARQRMAVAFMAALLFALHPIHTEVVANVKSGDELLSFLLAFAGLLACIKYAKGGKPMLLAGGILCFFLAHLAKESVFTFLAIVPVVFFFFVNDNKKRSLHISLGFALAAGLFLIIRYAVLSHWHVSSVPNISDLENALEKKGLPAATRLATAMLMMGIYVKLLFVPYPLLSDYSFNTVPYAHFADVPVLLSLAVYVALAVVAVIRFMKDRRDPYAFAILFFFVTIALFSNIFIAIKATMGERFMFYPSVGFCLAAALLLERWAGKDAGTDMGLVTRPKVLALLLPICLLFAADTIARNGDWLDNYTLYTTDAAKAPDNCRINYLAGDAMFTMYHQETNPAEKQKLLARVIPYFQRTLAIKPDYEYAVADMGAAYFCNGQYDSAEYYDLRMIRLNPKYALVRNNLSGVYMSTKQFRKGVNLGKETIAALPQNVNAYADLGIYYRELGHLDSAMYYLDMGIAVQPGFYGFYMVKSDVFYAMGKFDSAARYKEIGKSLMK